MKFIVPDYYKDFCCIAERCRHNCCIGWEIDIDDDTYELYKNIPGGFGDRLRDGISHGETLCFKLGEDERCVFLNERGLCDIILNLGEDALCDICTDHPRFRNFFADRTEIGLGLCCEEACRVILGCTDTVKLSEIEDDGEDVPDPLETDFFSERQHVFDVLQDRSMTLADRLCRLSAEYVISDDLRSPTKWAEFYCGLERLNYEWDKYLDVLADCDSFAAPDGTEAVWEQLAVYLVYRHTAENLMSEGLAFCIHTVRLLCTLCTAVSADFSEICDICRMWSSEIEYSEENTKSVIEKLIV